MAHVYCPECGFQNPESANYCSKCGALLVKEENVEATMAFTPDVLADDGRPELAAGIQGPALVVRSGGGRAGETFPLDDEETTVGRSPDCDVFLDDVTVSRRHAVVTNRGSEVEIRDLGSLNGTFLNRRRIDSAALTDGDELQIGKYRLTFLE
jgi:pSer/pThr/pTyr-binding forkhead associated (FHA) protein